jgi:hypothetical protein
MLLSLALVFITMYHGNPCRQNGVKGAITVTELKQQNRPSKVNSI